MGAILYQHSSRQQWGLAIQAWKRGQQRGFQFEDGRLRAFHEDYLHLLLPVALTDQDTSRRRKALVNLLGYDPDNTKRRGGGKKKKQSAPAAFRFADQIELFSELHPDGFQGEAWCEAHRVPKNRALKRHRQPALTLAGELLGQEALDELLAAEDYDGVLANLDKVLAATDLVSAAQRKKLKGLEDASRRRFAVALRDLLHDEEEGLSLRFGRLVNELGASASWPLVTAPMALVHPEDHVCVRPSAFKEQARVLAPGLAFTKQPSVTLYEGYRTMSLTARDQLQEAKLSPCDLLDVYDFMGVTLQTKSLKKLKAKAAAAEQAPASAAA